LAISGSSKVVQANFLDGTEPKWKYNVGSRQLLAEWVTSPKNPFFARAGANRLWALFFGTGLVEPIDDLRAENPPSHPELLDELASQFAAHHFLDARQKIDALFLAALARPPRSDEAERFTRYLKEGGAKGDAKSALGDVFWVLLNSPEFLLNH